MRVWKKSSLLIALLSVTVSLQAEDVQQKARPQKSIVDMADSINNQDFYDAKNPNAVWTSELKMPWAKSDAVKAYDEAGNHDEGDKKAITVEHSSAAATAGAINAVPPASEAVGVVNGKTVDSEQLINIRVRYSMNTDKAQSFTPVTAQNALFRQMGHYCKNGFQKIAEWSEPVSGDDYYLYYQFKCMPRL